MKSAATTGGFQAYTHDQKDAIIKINNAGFQYIDYSFIMDHRNSTGIFGKNPEEYMNDMKRLAQKSGVKYVQAHSPMENLYEKDGRLNIQIELNDKFRMYVDTYDNTSEITERLTEIWHFPC